MNLKYSDFLDYMSDLKANIKQKYGQLVFDSVFRCMNYDHSDFGFRLYYEFDPDTILFFNYYFCETDELKDQDIKHVVLYWLYYCVQADIYGRLDF